MCFPNHFLLGCILSGNREQRTITPKNISVDGRRETKQHILANMTTQFIYSNPWRHQQFRVVSPPTDVQQSPQRMQTLDFASTKSSRWTPWNNMIDKCLFLRTREAVMAHVRHGSHLRKKKKFDCESVDTCSSNAAVTQHVSDTA